MIDISSDQLTLTSAEIQGNRWPYEQQKLRTFPKFKFLSTAGSSIIVAAEGTVNTQYNNTYGLRSELANYPFSLPKVRPSGWSIHPSAHTFNDGTMCVMRSDQWRRHFTVASHGCQGRHLAGKYEIGTQRQFLAGPRTTPLNLDFSSRIEHLLSPASLEGKVVLQVGLGSGGAPRFGTI